MKEVVEQVIQSKEYQDAVNSVKVQTKAMKNKEEVQMSISIKQMSDALIKDDVVSYKEAALQYMEENDVFTKAIADPRNYTVGFAKNLNVKVVGKGLKISGAIQKKDTLVVGDNTSSYTQANVEFADLFAPGLIDTFNNQTNLWGYLPKEQCQRGSHYQWKMITNRDPQSNSSFVSQSDVTVLKNFASKLNYQTPIKIARRGISVSDFVQRNTASSLGDEFSKEVEIQTNELIGDAATAIFAEVADGTGVNPLGLEAVADSAGNTTLYGLTRSTANRLAPDAAGSTLVTVSGALSEAALRSGITYLQTEGSELGNIAIVTSPTGRDYLFNLLDGQRQFLTTDATFGFTRAKVPSYDGVPVIVDHRCTSTATAASGACYYVIDAGNQGAVIEMQMAPTMTNLAKVGAAVEAYIELDFAFVYKQPRRVRLIDVVTS